MLHAKFQDHSTSGSGKCLFVSPDGQTHGRTDEQTDGHGQRSMPFRILRMAGA